MYIYDLRCHEYGTSDTIYFFYIVDFCHWMIFSINSNCNTLYVHYEASLLNYSSYFVRTQTSGS